MAGTAFPESGTETASAVVDAALERIGRHNDRLGAFTDVVADRARCATQAVASGGEGRLAGVPFAAKNLFDIAGIPTRAGSRINREHAAKTRDAFLIRRFQAEGAVLLGGLNMGEYAYDFTGENAHDGDSRNPHDLARMAGGSSGGSASAVAAGLVSFALASDTNGSIRVPSSLCGLFGIKPTFGRLGRSGTYPFVHSIDHVGMIGRSAGELALLFDIAQGDDPDDPVQDPPSFCDGRSDLDRGADGLRIAVAGGYFVRNGQSEAFEAVEAVAAALGVRETISLTHVEQARAAAQIISAAESGGLHRRQLMHRAAEYDPYARNRLIAGALTPAPWLDDAHRFRSWFMDQVIELFQSIDVLIAPATPCVAPMIGQQTFVIDGAEQPLRPNLGLYTQPISFVGLPVVAVPIARHGLPIGVQVIAAPWREDLALRVAHDLERRGVAAARIADTFT